MGYVRARGALKGRADLPAGLEGWGLVGRRKEFKLVMAYGEPPGDGPVSVSVQRPRVKMGNG